MANVGHDYSTGLELSGQVQLTRWWNVNLNGSLYHYKVKNQYKLNGTNEKSTNYDIIWNNAFDLGKSTRIQLDGNFGRPFRDYAGADRCFLVCEPGSPAAIDEPQIVCYAGFPRCLQFGPLCQQDHHIRPAIHHPDPSELSAYHVDVKLYI